jgi:hypothetical protein
VTPTERHPPAPLGQATQLLVDDGDDDERSSDISSSSSGHDHSDSARSSDPPLITLERASDKPARPRTMTETIWTPPRQQSLMEDHATVSILPEHVIADRRLVRYINVCTGSLETAPSVENIEVTFMIGLFNGLRILFTPTKTLLDVICKKIEDPVSRAAIEQRLYPNQVLTVGDHVNEPDVHGLGTEHFRKPILASATSEIFRVSALPPDTIASLPVKRPKSDTFLLRHESAARAVSVLFAQRLLSRIREIVSGTARKRGRKRTADSAGIAASTSSCTDERRR